MSNLLSGRVSRSFIFIAAALLLAAPGLGGCEGSATQDAGELADIGAGRADAKSEPSDVGGDDSGETGADILPGDGDIDAQDGRGEGDAAGDAGSSEADAYPADTAPDGTADAAEPPAQRPQKQAFFNDPGADGTPDYTNETVIKDLLEQALPGSKVRASYYTLTSPRMPQAFIDAQARGVDVKFIIDNNNKKSSDACVYNSAFQALVDGMTPGSVIICSDCSSQTCQDCTKGGCLGHRKNHNKFILFSELEDGSKDVVLQSSSNLTKSRRKFNNTLVIRDDTALYQAYMDYWETLKAQDADSWDYTSASGDTRTKVYFFPRKSGDTIISVLNNVDCSDPASRIRVAMGLFHKKRMSVAEKLVAKKQAGCTVEVLLGVNASSPSPEIVDTLTGGGVDARVYVREEPGRVTIHSKYLLIEGTYNGNANKKLLWTGSHNYTEGALRGNDETLLKINDRGIYEAYMDNWRHIRQRLDEL